MNVYRVEIDFGGIINYVQAESITDAFDLTVQNEVDIGAHSTYGEARKQMRKEVTQIREPEKSELQDNKFLDDADGKVHVMSEWVKKNKYRCVICSTEY